MLMCHFWKHLEVVKASFCYGKTSALNGQEVQVLKLLNARDLECQHGLFKLTMKFNAMACMAPPFDTNLPTRMWRLVTTFRILITSFPKYVKLAKLAMVQVVGSVEDETCFFILVFMKSKLHNRLTTHLLLM
jgi:hypothetical protein